MSKASTSKRSASTRSFGPRPSPTSPVRSSTCKNEKLADICAAQPDRFVGLASVALQHPDLAAEQLEDGVKRLGLRGALIGGSVNGEELSDPKFHPFWAKAEQLGVLIFIHQQGTAELSASGRFKGNGVMDNVIGNPLETRGWRGADGAAVAQVRR
jgi:predicted TIM-barrel fold metal-dependent hydrolase